MIYLADRPAQFFRAQRNNEAQLTAKVRAYVRDLLKDLPTFDVTLDITDLPPKQQITRLRARPDRKRQKKGHRS